MTITGRAQAPDFWSWSKERLEDSESAITVFEFCLGRSYGSTVPDRYGQLDHWGGCVRAPSPQSRARLVLAPLRRTARLGAEVVDGAYITHVESIWTRFSPESKASYEALNTKSDPANTRAFSTNGVSRLREKETG